MFFTMYHKLNLQQLLDKQMVSHFLGKVKFLEILFINLQSQVLPKKCQPMILFSARYTANLESPTQSYQI